MVNDGDEDDDEGFFLCVLAFFSWQFQTNDNLEIDAVGGDLFLLSITAK